MLESAISLFSEPDDFQAALEQSGCIGLIVTERGEFRARITELTLGRLRLSAVEERLSRIACYTLAPGLFRVIMPGPEGALVCGGIGLDRGAILTHHATKTVYERLSGPARWNDVILPTRRLARYGHVLTGADIVLPHAVHLWRPPTGALRRLAAVHAAALLTARTHTGGIPVVAADPGLEQTFMERLVECLATAQVNTKSAATDRHVTLMADLEGIADDYWDRSPSIPEICAALGISERTLRGCCHEHLNMAPNRYFRLRRMQQARRVLRDADPNTVTVAQVAKQHGFRELGRFAAAYRAAFGELPSTTLHRQLVG